MSSTEVPQMLYAVLFGSILCIGFPLNAIAIWSLFHHHSFKLPNVMFMVNLAISDLLLASSLPLRVYYYATGTWPFGDIVCFSAKALFSINIRSSSIFITYISVDRLLAIVYPLRSRYIRTAGNALKAVVIVWLFVIILSIPKCIFLKQHFKQHKNESFCFAHPHQRDEHRDRKKVQLVEGIFQFTLVLVLLTVNIVSTVLVSLTLRRNVAGLSKVNSKVNVLLLLAMNLVMFALCFVPETMRFFVTMKGITLKSLGAVNCCLDPLLYYFFMDTFWKKKRSNSNQET